MGLEDIGQFVEGVWMPKGEKHLLEWMQNSKGAHRENGTMTYQWAKQVEARQAMVEHISEWPSKMFVDVGAHVGLWSMWWSPLMDATLAFEPIPTMAALYHANMKGRGAYHLEEKAVGEFPGTLKLAFNPENTGNTHKVHSKDEGLDVFTVPLTTVDYEIVRFAGPRVGAMKIDCEGTELEVVKGATLMIDRDRPVIIVEQKKGAEYYGADPLGAVKFLEKECGYRTRKVMSGDHIMVPR